MKVLLSLFTLLLSFNLWASYEGKLEVITAKELLDNRDNYIVLDTRSAGEFAEGHISGAINIPHTKVKENIEFLRKLNKPIVIHCRSGRRALVAEEALLDANFKALKHLEGDILGWEQQDLPLVQKN